jgi:DnaJ-class molecular chaperone
MKCYTCNGEGGYVHPDGLSSHPCDTCKGTGKEQKVNDDINVNLNITKWIRKIWNRINNA